MPTNPLNITVYDKTFRRLGWLNDPDAATFTPRHLVIGTGSITVPTDHPKVPLLGAPGNRLCVEYLGKVTMSGPIRNTQGQGGRFNGTLTYGIESDERLFWRMLGWPAPTSPITNQGIKSDDRTGPAETVLKGYIGANATRLGLPVVIAPDQGRGATITASVRMVPLTDVLLPQLTGSGIGLTVVQEDDHLLVDVYETATHPRILTERSGIVQSWSWSTQAPTVTRTVVAGAGTGTSQEFQQVTDTAAETLWGDVIESVTDGTDLDYPALPADVQAKGQATLSDGAASAGLSITFSETDNFRYGDKINVGDTVTLEVGPGLTTTDVLTEATLNYTRDNGFTAGPTVGDKSDDTTKTLVKLLVQLGRAARKRITT